MPFKPDAGSLNGIPIELGTPGNGQGISYNQATNEWEFVDLASISGLEFQGDWDADTNDPDLTTTPPPTGHFWRVTVAGSTDLGGITDWQIGDYCVKSATGWVKFDGSDLVTSVFGRIGIVTAQSGDYDAAQINYEPNELTDWNGNADPGQTDDAIDQLALREKAKEIIFTDANEPTGFINRTDSEISFNDGLMRLTIQPKAPATEFSYYIKGAKKTKDSAQTADITDTEGLWFVYFDGDTLTASQTPWILGQVAPVALLYWDSTNNKAITLNDERHGIVMDSATHYYLHSTIGARYRTGLGLGNYTTTGDGSAEADARCSIDDGYVADEDIANLIQDGNPQELSPIAEIPVYYLDTASAYWRKVTANTFPVKQGTARIQWNQESGGVWSTVDATSEDYFVAMWILGSNDLVEPIVAILGQREDSTLENAKDNNTYGSLALANIPSVEWKILYRLIFQTNSGYANTPHAKLVDVQDLRSVSNVPGGSYVATDHNSLTGRDTAGSHPSSAVGLGNVSNDAQLKRSAGDFGTFDEKTSPAAADILLLEDSGDANNKKRVQVSNLGGRSIGPVSNPAQLTANINNWSPTDLATARVFRISSDATRNVTGLVAQTANDAIYFTNIGVNNIRFMAEDSNSLAANRFALGANLTIQPGQSVKFWYDGTSNRWRSLSDQQN